MSTSSDSSFTPRRDPTQTTTKRDRLSGELNSRVQDVRGATRQQIEQPDQPTGVSTSTLIGAGVTGASGLAAFRTIGAFRRWLSNLFDSRVLGATTPQQVRRGQHWLASYVRESYLTGLRQSRAALRAQGYDIDSRDVEAVIADERHQRALASLYGRSYYDLQDAVDNSVQEASRAIADGGYIGEETVRGDVNKGELAGTLNERIDANHGKRIDHLGDSIPVKSANSAALEEYHEAGVDAVGVEPEADEDREVAFRTAEDPYVCDECREIQEDNPYSLSEVPIPVVSTHPRCRCWLMPLPRGVTVVQ